MKEEKGQTKSLACQTQFSEEVVRDKPAFAAGLVHAMCYGFSRDAGTWE